MLLQLEKCFFKHSCISDEKWLSSVIDDNFTECGSSGCLYDKHNTVKDLLLCSSDRSIQIYNFICRNIDENTYLVNYITKSENGELYFRVSVWSNLKSEKFEPKLFYHQSTKLNENPDLTEF